MTQIKGKIVLITGCDNGIGKQTAYELAAAGATVLVHAQDLLKGIAAIQSLLRRLPNGDFDLFIADFNDTRNIKQMALDIRIAYPKLDVLINNESVYLEEQMLTVDSIEKTFAFNHIAGFLLTHLLLPVLKHSANPRIINVSSHAHFVAKFNVRKLQWEEFFDGPKAYSRSKLCNLLFTYALAEKMKGQNITVNAVHPGSIITGVSDKLFGQPPGQTDEDGADSIVFLTVSDKVANVSGAYFVSRSPIESSSVSYSKKYQRQLWKLSEQLTLTNDLVTAANESFKVIINTRQSTILQIVRSKMLNLRKWLNKKQPRKSLYYQDKPGMTGS